MRSTNCSHDSATGMNLCAPIFLRTYVRLSIVKPDQRSSRGPTVNIANNHNEQAKIVSITNQLELTTPSRNKIAGVLIITAREISNILSVIEPPRASVCDEELDSPWIIGLTARSPTAWGRKIPDTLENANE